MREGDIANDMFLVIEGKVLVCSEDLKSIFDSISEGGYFGEVGVLKGWKRTASVVVESKVAALVVLSGDSLKEVIAMYPDSTDMLVHSYDERMDKAQKRAEIKSLAREKSRIDPLVIDPIPAKLFVDPSIASIKSLSKYWSSEQFSISSRGSSADQKCLREQYIPITNVIQLSTAELELIFKFIPVEGRLLLLRTCTRFRKLDMSHELWENLDFRPLSFSVSKSTFESISLKIWSHVRVLNLSSCFNVDDNCLKNISANCKVLQSLDLSSCWRVTNVGIKYIAERLSGLTELNISNNAKISGESFLDHNLSCLLAVNLSYCPRLSEIGFEYLLGNTPDLKALTLRRAKLLGDYALYLIAKYCPELEDLDLHDGMNFSDRYIRLLFTSCPKIETLKLSFCRNISLIGFNSIAECVLPLTMLDLSYCSSITNSVIVNFKESIKNLKKFYLRACKKLNNRIGPVLKIFAPHLIELDIRGCPNLSKVALQSWIPGATILFDSKFNVTEEMENRIEIRVKESKHIGLKKRVQAISSILDLSAGELQLILSNVSPRKIMSLSRTCKLMRETIRTPYFWTKIDFQKNYHWLNGIQLQCFINIAGNYLRVLDISMCSYLVDADLALVAQTCINIQSLILVNCWRLTDRSISIVSQRLTGLRLLNVSHCPKVNGAGFLDHRMQNLESFVGSYCRHLSTSGILNLVAKANNIQKLIFRRCEGLANRSLGVIAQYCPQLKEIDLSDGFQFTDTAICRLILNCNDLKSIKIRFCAGIGLRGFLAISTAQQKFMKLDLSYCREVSDEIILNFKHNILKLEYLSLQQCPCITAVALSHIATYCPRLKYLNIRGCCNLTRNLVESLFRNRNVRIDVSDPPEARGVRRSSKPLIVEYKDVARSSSTSRLLGQNQISIKKLAENSIMKYSKSDQAIHERKTAGDFKKLKVLRHILDPEIENVVTRGASQLNIYADLESRLSVHDSDETLGPRCSKVYKKIRFDFKGLIRKMLRLKSSR